MAGSAVWAGLYAGVRSSLDGGEKGPQRDHLEDEVRRKGEELRELKAKLERSSKLTMFTARDAGEAKAALQVAVFLTGLFREHMQGILRTYQDARDQAREGGGVASASTGHVEPLKVLMYNGLGSSSIWWLTPRRCARRHLLAAKRLLDFLLARISPASLTHSVPLLRMHRGC